MPPSFGISLGCSAFPKTVALIGAALLALWGLSFGLSYVDLGGAALPVALDPPGTHPGTPTADLPLR